MTAAAIDALVVCYHSERWLRRCLESLSGQTLPLRTVHVIDNGHMEAGAFDGIEIGDLDVRYVRMRRNAKYGGGNNLGFDRASRAGADFVLVVNPDMWLEPDAVEHMVAACGRDERLGVASGVQLAYDSDEWSKWARVHVRGPGSGGVVECDWLEGSCLFLPIRLVRELGGFDPIYPMYYEDMDLCRRARLRGYRCAVVLDARYHHYSNASFLDHASPQRTTQIDASQFIFMITDPASTWINNHFVAGRWLLRRVLAWVRGRRPGFGGAMGRIGRLQVGRRRELKTNWRRRRRGDLSVQLEAVDTWVEHEARVQPE